MLSVIMLSVIMLGVIYTECGYAECLKLAIYADCLNAECRYAECLYAECHGANFLGFSCHSDTSLSSKKMLYILPKKMFLFTKTLQLFRAEIRVAEI